jgi:hypothetical protein
MPRRKKPETSSNKPSQIEKFQQKARELGCDDDEAAFREKLKQLTSAPPPASVEKRKRRTKI